MHKIQPLDVGVFSSVQRAWTKHCDKQLANGVEIDCYNFIHKYMAIHHVITPELIQKVFKKTGIYPLNPSIFTDKDFAPSLVYSTTAHLPTSYPSKIPSSPMAASSDLEDDDFFPMAINEHNSESESDYLEGEISQ